MFRYRFVTKSIARHYPRNIHHNDERHKEQHPCRKHRAPLILLVQYAPYFAIEDRQCKREIRAHEGQLEECTQGMQQQHSQPCTDAEDYSNYKGEMHNILIVVRPHN